MALLASALCYTFLVIASGVFTAQQIDLFNQIFWRLLFGIIFAGALAFGIFKEKFTLNSKELGYLLINSLIFLGGFTTFSGAIYLGTPLAKAVALNYAYPLVVIFLSYFLLREVPTFKQWCGVGLSLLSVFLLIEIWKIKGFEWLAFGTTPQSSQVAPTTQIGDYLAFANSWFYGSIIVFGRKMKIETNLNHFKSLFYSHLFMMPMFLLLAFVLSKLGSNFLQPSFNVSFSAFNWLLLLGSAIIGGILPLYFIYYGVSKVKPYVASVLLLTEPIWVFIFGWLIFQQTLTPWSLAGGAGIILSVFLL